MKKRKLIMQAAVLSLSVLLLVRGSTISRAALDALSLSVKRVIPSLFPYMVLSQMTVRLGLADGLGRFIPMNLFGLPGCTAPVFVTGLMCGFPVGASGSRVLCESGRITEDEAARLCALSSHVSPAFLVGTVGTVFSSKAFGWYLFACGLIYASVSGIVTGRGKHSSPSAGYAPMEYVSRDPVSVFCSSITDSCASCLGVTGFIVFFGALSAGIASVVPALEPFASVLFEFSGGTVYASGIGGVAGAALAGFAVGFSGFSVLAQIASYTSPAKIPFGPVLMSKLLEGVFMSAAASVFCLANPLKPSSEAFGFAEDVSAPLLIAVPAVLLAVFLAGEFLRHGNKFRAGA